VMIERNVCFGFLLVVSVGGGLVGVTVMWWTVCLCLNAVSA
jgi:hypothetical protein